MHGWSWLLPRPVLSAEVCLRCPPFLLAFPTTLREGLKVLVQGQAGCVRHKALAKAQEREGLRAPAAPRGGGAAAATTPASKGKAAGGASRRGSSGRHSAGAGMSSAGRSLEREYVACSSVQEQAACLVDMATDPGILAHTWAGWRPWL